MNGFTRQDVLFIHARFRVYVLYCIFFSNCRLSELQLPCRSGPESPHTRVNEKRSQKCLIDISRYRFSLVISGLTKMLQRVNELTPSTSGQRPFHTMDQDRQESIIIVLDTLEKCLANAPKDTTKFEEATNVKLLLREISQFIGVNVDERRNLLILSRRLAISKGGCCNCDLLQPFRTIVPRRK